MRSLGVDAVLNDRNDICVGKEKICYSIDGGFILVSNETALYTSRARRTRSSTTARTTMGLCSSQRVSIRLGICYA